MSVQKQSTAVGLTKDVGYQIGVRRTINFSVQKVWPFIYSVQGISIWLGKGIIFKPCAGTKYQLKDGSSGEFRVIKTNSHLRLTWKPMDWTKPSTIQVRLIPNKTRTILAFHQENLPDSAQRENRKSFFKSAINSSNCRWALGCARHAPRTFDCPRGRRRS